MMDDQKMKVGLVRKGSDHQQTREEDMELRRGPWTVEEDFTLINFIAHHGEGRWNSLARCAGLKRTGKSCRLRWLNYLRPDVRLGNITLEEQLLILELHSRWGNRWSKIAQQLPGRTDNEIKNYWRTRVQKHAKQLKCDVNSKQFKDTMKYLWMPRLAERIQAAAAATTAASHGIQNQESQQPLTNMSDFVTIPLVEKTNNFNYSGVSSDNSQVSPEPSDLTDANCYNYVINNQDYSQLNYGESLISPTANYFQAMDQQQWTDNVITNTGYVSDTSWNIEDMWFLHQQFNNSL